MTESDTLLRGLGEVPEDPGDDPAESLLQDLHARGAFSAAGTSGVRAHPVPALMATDPGSVTTSPPPHYFPFGRRGSMASGTRTSPVDATRPPCLTLEIARADDPGSFVGLRGESKQSEQGAHYVPPDDHAAVDGRR
jgi:hypothetical protein